MKAQWSRPESHAGDKGFNINVGKNADLNGAVISSAAAPDKAKLSTDTLTYEDIQSKAKYSSDSKSVNHNAGNNADKLELAAVDLDKYLSAVLKKYGTKKYSVNISLDFTYPPEMVKKIIYGK